MVPDAFLVRLAASFAAGFSIVALVTALADLSGEGPAGFIGGLPSTGAVALLAIGLTQSTSAAVEATTLFPLGFSVAFAFLLFYTAPVQMRFWPRMCLALALWAVSALAAALWRPDDFAVSLAGSTLVSAAVFFARRRITTGTAGHSDVKPGWARIVLRGSLGGSVVSGVVLVSAVGGPLVGGLFAAAPAIWSSSLYVTAQTHGIEFSRSITRTFMRTGIMTTIPYAVAVRYLFPVSGVWLGTALGYVAISPLAYLAWKLAKAN